MVTMLLLWAACGSGEKPASETPATEGAYLSTLQWVQRASLDLRGVRLSGEELATLEEDPEAADALIDSFFDDPRFEGRMVDLYAEHFLTRSDYYPIQATAYGLTDNAAFQEAVGDEVPRVLAHIAATDRPYTELVTGDWTMANEILAEAWPIERAEGEGWVEAHYTDGRPAAGVLATNSLWWRYTSTDSNANRKRANAISRTLLCYDYLNRPIEFDRNVNLLESGAVEDALHNNPGCANCHVSLDPMASYLFGFWWYDYTNPAEASYYFPERELRWRSYGNNAPAFYGTPGAGLSDLGRQVAADARYPACAVETAWKLLLRRAPTVDDTSALTAHRNAFLSSDLHLKALLRSIVHDPAYMGVDPSASASVPLKMTTPDLMASQIEGLTGYRWTYGGYDLMKSDTVGFLTLAGGADGLTVSASATAPNATLLLVQQRLAEAAADYAVQTEPSRLLTIDLDATPEAAPDDFVAQIQALHWALYGDRVAADGPEVTANLELWSELYTVTRDTRRAWAGLLAVLLRDPEMLFY